MRVKSDPGPLFDHASTAFYAAADDTLQHAKSIAPRITGQYANSMKMWRRKRAKGPTARIGSRLPQAGVLERGGWVKGRGPHIARSNAPGTLRQAGEKFGEFYAARLRSTPINASAFVIGEFGGERGAPGLELGSGL